MAELHEFQGHSLSKLRKKWFVLVVFCVVILALGHQYLRVQWTVAAADQWRLLTVFGFGYALLLLWQDLPLNRRIGEQELLADFGPGTVLTITRGVLVALLAGFLFNNRPEGLLIWAPAGLYWLSNLTDFLDGFLARKTNRVTLLGESLDIKLDGFGVLIATLLIVQYRQVPLWYVLVGLARYLFVIGLWVRDQLGKGSVDLPPSVRRRAFAGIQMGFVGVILLPVFHPPGTVWVATVFGLLFLLGFIVDWFMVSGVLDLKSLARYASISRIALKGLTIGLRMVSSGLLAFLIYQRIVQTRSSIGPAAPGPDWFLWLEGLLLVMLTLGAAGRTAALVTMLLMGVYQMSIHLSGPQTLLVITSAMLFFLGTGPFSIWNPENRLIDWRAGEST